MVDISWFWTSVLYLVCSPDVAVLVLLVLALDDLHLVLDGLLVKDWADEVGHEPGTMACHEATVHLLDSTVILKNLNSYLFLFLLKIVSINKQRIRLCKDDISCRRTFFVHPPNKRSLIFFLFIFRCDGFLREVLKTLFIKCTLFVSYLVNLLVNTLSNK